MNLPIGGGHRRVGRKRIAAMPEGGAADFQQKGATDADPQNISVQDRPSL